MDPLTPAPARYLPEGFAGQRMVVLPRPSVRAALQRPVTSRLLVTDAGFFPHAARHGRARPDSSPEHVVLVCTGGGGWCQTPAGRLEVRHGDALVLPAGVPHRYAATHEDPWTLWWMHVTGTDSAELASAAHAAAGGALTHLREVDPVTGLLARALDALDTATPAGLVRASGAAWNVLTEIIATGRRSRGTAPDPIERAVEHLRATAPRRTSIAELASIVGLSPSQLRARFGREVGVPPLRYQRDLRMARARELLDATDEPIAAVAHACGYSDPLYFSRQFTHAHGISPSAHRARAA